MGKQAPAPGNYTNAANAQASASQGAVNTQTQANRPDVNGAFTSQQWTQGPDGRWTLNAGYGRSQGIADQLQQQAYANAGMPMPTGDSARDSAIDSAWSAAKSRLDPLWAQQDQLHASSLANAGIDPASAAARASDMAHNNQRNDAYGQALANAVHEGNAVGHQVFQDDMMARNTPLQQLLAMAGQTGGTNFNAAGLAQSPELLAAMMGQDRANMGAWQAQNQANADVANGGASAMGSALGAVLKMFAF